MTRLVGHHVVILLLKDAEEKERVGRRRELGVIVYREDLDRGLDSVDSLREGSLLLLLSKGLKSSLLR